MIRPRIAMAFGAVFAVVAASGQGVTAAGASTPVPASAQIASSASPDKAQLVAAEQSQAASAGQALGIGPGEKLVVKDVITDADGTTHVRYNRTFNGLRVIGGDLVSHRDKAGKIKSVNWNAARTVGVASMKAKISLASAKAVGARKALSVQKTTSATTGGLVVYAGASPKATPKLAYDVLAQGVQADQTPSRLHTIVDANTGATLLSFDEIKDGTGHGVHVGTVTIGTTGSGPWSMRDSVGNYATDLGGAAVDVPGILFTDPDNVWGDGTVSDRASAAVDAHYGAGKTFDYFKNVLGRNGIWNTGVGARSRVHYGYAFQNAYWDGTQMTYGDGAGNARPLTEIDVAGHEMTHGVTENTADLVYAGESGGLNEATSDIFGTAVEWYANDLPADNPDYLIGELINLNGDSTPLRYMDRPSRDWDPVYGGSPDCWSPTVGNLDVHNSSGPLNHWFYLASEGSGPKVINYVSYNSPTCNASTVTGIGRAAAEKIWYRTLTVYLTSSNNYAAAREGAIQSAKDLYGATSTQCTGVAAAFSAIAVPPGGATCTAAPPPPPVGSNLLRNPGFESGNTLWSASQGVIFQWGAYGQPPRTGTWNTYLLGYPDAIFPDPPVNHYESIAQLVTIPAGRTATLSYYVHIDTDEAPGAPAYDTMKVSAGSTVLQTLSNVNAAAGYQLKTVSLSAYAGRTISLSFAGAQDTGAQTSFVLDDLSVTTKAIVALDFTGDGKADVHTVRTNGDLYLYRGNGLGGFISGAKIGSGWGIFAKVFSPGDFTSDGKADIVAIKTNGDLFLYRGNGLGGFTGVGTKIGAGWSIFSKVFSPGDFSGDGKADLLAMKPNGDLFLYRGNGVGGFTGVGTKIGAGWSIFSQVFSPRDFSGDGKADLLAMKPNGDLFLYRGNGVGAFTGVGTKIGSGWSIFTKVFSVGDFTGDSKSDLLAIKTNGEMYLYRGNGLGGFTGAGTKIGTGWTGLLQVF